MTQVIGAPGTVRDLQGNTLAGRVSPVPPVVDPAPSVVTNPDDAGPVAVEPTPVETPVIP